MSNVESHGRKTHTPWNAPGGTYDEISRSIADAIEHAIDRFQPRPGQHILDLATGTRWGRAGHLRRFLLPEGPARSVEGV